MQKHIRASVTRPRRSASARHVYLEPLNPHTGFFYTVKSVLAHAKTRFQDLALLDTDDFGKVLLLDHITQVADACDFYYHEPMVHPALVTHADPRSVLVIGGGDGGILREVLKYRVVRAVDLAELDDQVIAFSKQHLKKVHGGAFDDPRLTVHVTEGRHFVEERPHHYDVVIMDMTDPSGPSRLLYTKEFYGAVKRSLRDNNGVFVMHSESPVARPCAFACIQATLRAVFPHVHTFYLFIPMYGTLWSISVCGMNTRVATIRPSEVDATLRRRNIRDLNIYSGATHSAMQTPFPCIARILSRPARIITDAHPDFPDAPPFPNHRRKGVRR